MVRTLLAKGRIVRAAYRCSQPDPALGVEHRIVIIGLGAPDLFVAPIGGGLHRLSAEAEARRLRHFGTSTGILKNVTLLVFGSRIGMSSLAYSGEPNSGPLALTAGLRRSEEIRSCM